MDLSDHSRLLVISGHTPVDVDGTGVNGFAAQWRQTWATLEAQLRAAAMGVANLVKVTIYLSDRRHAAENRAIRTEVLGTHQPSMTVVICGISDDAWLLESEPIAAT